ncbi:putative XRE-type DNA-binding protein [Rhodobium orientis]|uniref:XRE family transcriptional regulator n=1 Tax=Rhodobium orientis TaxID=34017 RepID=A0A327JWU4_9HYPH|nr:helix-turn-helix transcriptional regulator [Rhodobium orientis]MBB4301196.1 putative XRE-type DNA-binding protein [Rhodobium orientis]MBK5951211.1 XRE family transcriptional regulator [Rhodobium orientis]RAI30035.1 XRE family transcriptional regulator [Rhodobium orientis]
MTDEKTDAVVVGSGNVFADLGLPDADEHLLKAEIVVQLKRLIAERQLTQTKAATLIGMAQPDLSNLLRGQLRGVSVERLMRALTALGQDIDIRIGPRDDDSRPARIRVLATESGA